jgi:hypothetical protein
MILRRNNLIWRLGKVPPASFDAPAAHPDSSACAQLETIKLLLMVTFGGFSQPRLTWT